MIKTRVNQIQRRRFAAQQLSQKGRHGGIRSEAVTDPQQFLPTIEQSIACPLKRYIMRPVQNFKSIFREPETVMRFFTLSFCAAETANNDPLAENDARICRENEIRQILLGRLQYH